MGQFSLCWSRAQTYRLGQVTWEGVGSPFFPLVGSQASQCPHQQTSLPTHLHLCPTPPPLDLPLPGIKSAAGSCPPSIRCSFLFLLVLQPGCSCCPQPEAGQSSPLDSSCLLSPRRFQQSGCPARTWTNPVGRMLVTKGHWPNQIPKTKLIWLLDGPPKL